MKTKLFRKTVMLITLHFILIIFSSLSFAQNKPPMQHPKLTPEQQRFLDQFSTMIREPENRPVFQIIMNQIKRMTAQFENTGRSFGDAGIQNAEKFRQLGDKAFSEQLKPIIELDTKSFELTRDFRQAVDQGEKDKILKELETTLNKLFDLKEELRENEIKRLESDLKRMREKVTERKKNKNIIIKKRLEQMIEKKDDLEW